MFVGVAVRGEVSWGLRDLRRRQGVCRSEATFLDIASPFLNQLSSFHIKLEHLQFIRFQFYSYGPIWIPSTRQQYCLFFIRLQNFSEYSLYDNNSNTNTKLVFACSISANKQKRSKLHFISNFFFVLSAIV